MLLLIQIPVLYTDSHYETHNTMSSKTISAKVQLILAAWGYNTAEHQDQARWVKKRGQCNALYIVHIVSWDRNGLRRHGFTSSEAIM